MLFADFDIEEHFAEVFESVFIGVCSGDFGGDFGTPDGFAFYIEPVRDDGEVEAGEVEYFELVGVGEDFFEVWSVVVGSVELDEVGLSVSA